MKGCFVFIFFILASGSFSQKINDESAFLEGDFDRKLFADHKVMAVSVTTYLDDQKIGLRYFEFEPNGQLSMMVYRNRQDEMSGIHHFIFDGHNNLQQRLSMNLSTGINDTVHYYRVYKGNLLLSDSGSDAKDITKYVYNDSGLLVEKIMDANSDLFGSLVQKWVYAYDKDGRIAEIKSYFTGEMTEMKPELTSHKIRVYNEKGWLMTEKEQVLKAETGDITYEYDSAGRCVKIAKAKAETATYAYDSRGLLQKKTTRFSDEDFDGIMVHHFSYQFSDDND